MFNVHILMSGDFHRIELHMHAIYLCANFLATLAFRLSLDVTIIVDNTKGFTDHTTRGIRVLICSSACFRAQCVKSLCQKRMLLYVSDLANTCNK